MKILLIILLFAVISLSADSKETCYTVQLLSSSNAEKKFNLLKKNSYPDSCKVMEIGESLSVRCGCFEKKFLAKMKQHELKKNYNNATVVSTYKYRFNKETVLDYKEKNATAPHEQRQDESLSQNDDKQNLYVQQRDLTKQSSDSAIDYIFQTDANALAQNTQLERKKLRENTQADSTDYIDLTLIGRYMSNDTYFTQSPYAFVLFDTEYNFENWKIAAGVYGQKDKTAPDLPINHLFAEFFGDKFHFKIGKMVEKVGVLDYFSMLDTLNPIRFEFFDDSNINIKRIPLWMAHLDYYPTETLKLSFYAQPFDSEHQDYTGHYVNYVLNQFVPQHYDEFFEQDPIGEQIYSPVYYNAISPFLAQDVESKLPSSSMKLENTSVGFCAEYSDDSKKMGFIYFNRYTEIPLIRVDQNLLNAAIHYKNGESVSQDFIDYLASLDLDPIKSIEGFRYNQAGLYVETTVGSYGLRGEAAYRDKIPLLNNFGSVSSLGFAVDYLASSVYYALETQYIHLDPYNKDSFIAMFTTKFDPVVFYSLRGHFENRFIGAAVDTTKDVAVNPSYIIEYDQTSLILQAIASNKNRDTNTVSILVRSVF
jgi:hypothetical protein